MTALIIFCVLFIGYIVYTVATVNKSSGANEVNKFSKDGSAFNPHMKCPHCDTKGQVATKKVGLKKGVSGGKAVAGLLTGGVSLLAVGLSRKEESTQASCGKCGNVWHF